MPVERSHGKRRPRTPRPGDAPLPSGTVLAVTMHDPKTGRFAPGNTASKLRALKGGARHLIGLDPTKCAPWARDFVALANADARRLVEEHGVQDDTALVRLAENAALANAVARGLTVLGLQGEGDRTALAEAKAWAQEYRQTLLTLKGEAREHAKQRPPGNGGDLWGALGLQPLPEGSPTSTNAELHDDQGDDANAATHRGQDESDDDEPPAEATRSSTRQRATSGRVESRVSPSVTVAPQTSTRMPVPPAPQRARPMLMGEQSRPMHAHVMPAPPVTGQANLDAKKPPLPFWVQLPDGRTVRSDNLPPEELQRMRAEGRLP